MEVRQHYVMSDSEIGELDISPDLILVFVSPSYPDPQKLVDTIVQHFPDAIVAGSSTAGEIHGTSVLDGGCSVTAIEFKSTRVDVSKYLLEDISKSREAGIELINGIEKEGLKHIIVFSEGLYVNGADLVSGMRDACNDTISITGGLAADSDSFNRTFVICNAGIHENKLVAIALYGDDLKVGFASKGGWDVFGIHRVVTRSKDNILYELDGKPALALYKSFLGNQAKYLPASGLVFPLSLRTEENAPPVVRTILAIDEEAQSLTFAGNVPEGSSVQLMKANIDRLIDGAHESAENSFTHKPELCLLISCVGRRLVLKQLVEEEVEAVSEVVGEQATICGFYSYGEIAPFDEFTNCELHNQTMTITSLSE